MYALYADTEKVPKLWETGTCIFTSCLMLTKSGSGLLLFVAWGIGNKKKKGKGFLFFSLFPSFHLILFGNDEDTLCNFTFLRRVNDLKSMSMIDSCAKLECWVERPKLTVSIKQTQEVCT